MRRAFDLARNGRGKVAPNPMVGCAVVHDGKIIGEGNYEMFGGPHAEVNAINRIPQEYAHLIPKATVYVSLEPCSIHAKTPPCSQFLVSKNVKKVVVSNVDPNPDIAGNGLRELKAAGIEVTHGLLEESGKNLNRRFFTFHQKNRPYVILKWGQTQNGFMASHLEEQKWITNEAANRVSHIWRTHEAAIMVGTNTARIDNPQLTARLVEGNDPVRVVLDRKLSLSGDLNLFDRKVKTLVFSEKDQDSHGNLKYEKVNFSKDLVAQVMAKLYDQKLLSLIVEGGPTLLNSFVDSGQWDEARITTSSVSWKHGKKAPTIFGNLVGKQIVGDNQIHTYRNPEQPIQ